MARYIVALIVSVIVTVVLFIYAAMAGGMCHCMDHAFGLFPYGTVVTMRTSWELTGTVLTFIQFPLYTMIFMVLRTNRARVTAVVIIVLVHAIAAWLGLYSHKRSRFSQNIVLDSSVS